MFFVELRLYTVSALTVRVVILPDFSAARAFAAATRIWREIPPFYPSFLLSLMDNLCKNNYIRENLHRCRTHYPCNKSGRSAALTSATPVVASAIDLSSAAFSTLVSRSSRGSLSLSYSSFSSLLIGSMRQSILGDRGCNRSGEHEGSSIDAISETIGYRDRKVSE